MHIIIPKSNFLHHGGINSHCRRVDLLLFAVLAQIFPFMTAVISRFSLFRRVAGDQPSSQLLPFRPFLRVAGDIP